MKNFASFKNWILRSIAINGKKSIVAVYYIIFLMLPVRKHTLTEAANLFNINKSTFSKFLKNNPECSICNLNRLARRRSRKLFRKSKYLADGKLPWKIAIIIDSTLQNRASLHADNSKKFNHGKGYVIGHQWTNIILLINRTVIPLQPIPFYAKKYCKNNKLTYISENKAIVNYLNKLDLCQYIGPHHSSEVVVLADSGYDDKKIEKAIINKGWKFIFALTKSRTVKSLRENTNSKESVDWSKVFEFFKNHRWAKWQTIRVPTNSPKRKRMEFRIRQIFGFLRHVGKVQLICSEFKKRPDGRRKFLACSDLNVKARLIIIAYRLRWIIEIFHKQVKMFLGFEDIAAKHFESVVSHVHWVYCAYILLGLSPSWISGKTTLLSEKQRHVRAIFDTQEKSRIMQLLSQFGGIERYKEELARSMV